MSWINSYLTYLSCHRTDIIFIILLTACTGALCTACLLLIERFLGYREAKIMKIGVRVTMLAYVLPIVYAIVIVRRDGILFGQEYYVESIFKMSAGMWMIVRFLLVLWIAAILSQVVDLIKCQFQLHEIRKGNIPAEYGMQENMEILRCKYGVKRKIGIYQNDSVATPVLAGFFKPEIIFPYRFYSEKEQQVAITHELMHYKNRDHIRKWLIELIVLLNGWNPLVYQLRRIHNVAIEFACDERSTEEGKEFFTGKEYFNMIVEDALKMYEPPSVTMSPIGQEPGEIEGRVIYMFNKSNQSKAKKYVLGLAVAVAMLGSSFVSYAMGEGLAGGQELLYRSMADWNELAVVENGEECQTMIADDSVEEVMMDANGLTRALKNLNWDVAKNQRVVSTEQMYLASGSTVGFTVEVTPGDKTVMIGIKSDADSIHYYNVTGTATREITVPATGYYRFCIQNDNSVAINVTGSYVY